MKIRTDFVTNSSSTSFVIITGGDFDKLDFFELMGVTPKSPFSPLFDALYYHMSSSMRPVREYCEQYQRAIGDWLEILRENFSEEVVDRILKAEENGYQILVGDPSTGQNLQKVVRQGFMRITTFNQ